MNIAMARNIGAHVKHVLAFNHDKITAGAGDDGVLQNGRSVNRLNYLSCVLTVLISAVLASTEKVSVTIQLQDSADGSTNWADYGDPLAITEVAADGSDENGEAELDVNLSAAKQYIRANLTITMSASGTDTSETMAVFTFAGEHKGPI